MSNNNTVNLNIRLTGNAGRELQQLTQQQTRGVQQINQGWRQVSTTQGQYARGLNTARTSQEQINRLTQQTTQSLQAQRRQNELMVHLLRQNAANARRMQEAINNINLRRTVGDAGRLNQNLNQSVGLLQRMGQMARNGLNTGTAIVGGVAAGAAVVNSQIQPARSYDKRLSDLTITATDFGDSYAKMDSVKKQLNTAIEASAKYGSKDDAVTAAEIMMSSGAYSRENLATALTTTTKTAFAANADPAAVASTTIALKNFGITVNDMDKAMNALYLGGKMGSFELKDQAKWLPIQLASVGSLGYNNVEGIKRIAAMNQVAMRTAGTTDEAGNNIVNFTDKIASKDFADAIAKNIKPQKGDPTKNGKLDWVTLMKNERGKGVLPVDAFVNLMNRELANNTEYQKLKNQKVDKNNPEAMKANIEGMMKIIEGTNIAKILTDRQARAGALALTKYNDDYQGMVSQMGQNGDAINKDAGWLSQQESSTYQQRINEQMNINYQAYLNVNGVLKTFNTEMGGFMQKHSGLATAAYSAGVVLAGIGALTTVGSVLSRLGGGAAAGGIAGTVASRAGGLMTAGRAAIGGVAGSAGMVAGAGAVGYGIGTIINKTLVENNATLSDRIGGTIHTILANMGVQSSKEALDQHFNSLINETQQNSQKYDQMIQEQRQTRTAIQQQTNAIRAIDLNVTMPSPVIQQISNPLRNIPTAFNTITNANPQNNPKRGTGVFIPYRH